MIKSQLIEFEDDTIELMKNDSVSSRQYLMRLTGWNNYYDFRGGEQDLRILAESILSFIKDKTDEN